MGLFTKTTSEDGEESTIELKDVTVVIKKSLWEKLGGFFWGILKLGLIFLIIVGIANAPSLEELENNTGNIEQVYLDPYFRTTSYDEEALRIGVVHASGVIVGGSGYTLGGDETTAEYFIQSLKTTIDNPDVDAVLIRVNSPGGELLATEQMTQMIDIVKESSGKNVYVVLEDMAASGGYYLATSGDRVFAYPQTLLGNIGVRIDTTNVEELMNKLGIKMNSITSGDMKDMGSPFKEMTEEERKVFEDLIDEAYDQFITRVSEGRGLTKTEAKKLADGRIFSGIQAKKNGLVDQLVTSFPELSREIALDMNQAHKDVQFIEFVPQMTPFQEFLMTIRGDVSGIKSELSPAQKTEFLMK
jgi:protease-4